MRTNCQWFGKRQSIKRQITSMYKRIHRYRIKFAKSAINMHAGNFKLNTAVRFSIAACNAATAIEIRHYSNDIADAEFIIWFYLYNFSTQFMTKHTRITEIRLCAFKCMEICSANANPVDLYDCVIF